MPLGLFSIFLEYIILLTIRTSFIYLDHTLSAASNLPSKYIQYTFNIPLVYRVLAMNISSIHVCPLKYLLFTIQCVLIYLQYTMYSLQVFRLMYQSNKLEYHVILAISCTCSIAWFLHVFTISQWQVDKGSKRQADGKKLVLRHVATSPVCKRFQEDPEFKIHDAKLSENF